MVTEKSCNLSKQWVDFPRKKGSGTSWASSEEHLPPRLWNSGLVSSGASLISWREGVFLTLVGHPSSDDVTIKMPYGVNVLHPPALHPIFSYWVG